MINGTLQEHIKQANEKIESAELELCLAKVKFIQTNWVSADEMRYAAIELWEMEREITKVKELNKFILGLYRMGV